MKYTQEIVIDLPRNRVAELMDSWENLYHWMEGLKRHEHLSGTPGKVGAKTKMFFEMGKRKIEMVETVTKQDFPNHFNATYEAKGVWNEVFNTFEATGENSTKWIQECEFRCAGFMRIMIFLMPGAFRKQSLKYMQDFKKFAENSGK